MSNIIIENNNNLIGNQLVVVNPKNKEFDLLMSLYKKASDKLVNELFKLKISLKKYYEYDVINSITSRIKSPTSIMNKMKKKEYEINYYNLVKNINDIAGIRITCLFKEDIYKLVNIIENISCLKVIKEKDYLTKPKKSGYSGYHLIVETPVEMDEDIIFVKAEIQIRTIAMDSWSTIEHKLKYKTKKKISTIDSMVLQLYAKIINKMDKRIMNMYSKQEIGKVNKIINE